ncbi:hypothetical protein Tco_1184509 [Tanacetum coccineum]
MFRDTLQLPVETLKNPFVAATNIHTIEAFMNKVGYQGVVDKVSAYFTKNLAQLWIKEDYHSIKDDIPLVIFHMAQHVIPAAQLVSQYKSIGRCNNYAVLQSILCSPECKIVGLILLDHCLSYALTVTADVPAVYLQQLWRKTSKNPFVAPANIHTIEAFMNKVGYQGVVDKVSAFFTKNLAQPWQTMFKVFNRYLTTRISGHDQTKINILQLFHAYPRFTKLIIADLMKKFPNIHKRIKEDYHSIKDDIPFVSVYTTRNVSVRGMLIPNAFLTARLGKRMILRRTNRNTPRAHRSPTVSANPLETKKRKQTAGESSSPRRILKKKKQPTPFISPPGDDRERDEIAEATLLNKESYVSEFADSILNDEGADVDDTESKIELGSQKENPKRVSDDDETKKEKEVAQDMKEKVVGKEQNIVEKEVENEPNVEAEKTNEIIKEKEVASVSGSQEIRNEQKQTPIPSPIRSHRNFLFPKKKVLEDLTDKISPTTATTSKTSFTTKHKKISFTLKTRHLPGSIAGMGRRRNLIRSHIKNKFITQEFFAEKIQELKKEMPRLVKLAVDKDREVFPVDIYVMVSNEFVAHGPKLIEELFRKQMQNTTLNLYPKTSSLTSTTSSADLQQQLYLTMKAKPQDQATDSEIWEILNAKFEKPYFFSHITMTNITMLILLKGEKHDEKIFWKANKCKGNLL